MSMELILEDLVEILEEESKTYSQLLQIARKKKEIIVHGKVNDLEKLVKVEQACIIHVGKLENRREDAINEVCRELGVSAEDITISGLSEKVGKESSKKLEKNRQEILNTVKELKSENEINSKLIKNSLEYIDFSLNLMANLNSDGSYLKSGQVNEPGKRNIIDLKL